MASFKTDWGNDNDPFLSAVSEAVPATLPSGSKTGKKFGINSSTEFQSPTNKTTDSFAGVVRRNTSQGRSTSNTRGGVDVSNTTPAAPRNVIVAGQSLSINQKPASNQQLKLDGFNRVEASNQNGRPQLSLTTKSPNNYSGFQQNTHSNNNPPASLSKTLQRLQPTNPNSSGGTGQSVDIDFLTNPYRTSAATIGAASTGRSNTQNKGTGRHTTQSYEGSRQTQQVEQKEELPLRPRGRESNKQFPASSTLRPTFNTPYKDSTTTTANKNSNNNSSNSRITRGSARKSPNNEVIDLVDDSDVEEVTAVPPHQQHQQLDNDIFRLYGSLPNFSDGQKRNAFSKTEDRLQVDHIYLGIYRFESSHGSSSTGRKLYLRVDGGNNQCLLLGLNTDMDKATTTDQDGVLGPAPIEIEEIPFTQIKKIMCGPLSPTSEKAFLTLSVTTTLSLNCVNVGPTCMLCPTLHQNTTDSGKFVLILLSRAALEEFLKQMHSVPFVTKKRNLNEWLAYKEWSSTTLKDFLFAHHNRKDHSIEELRERAELEVQARAKTQRRRNRSSALSNGGGNGAAVDPEDCLTHAMYPIEPEVLDAITIFKGDLKKLAPEEYLNDNLIDLKIKHLTATQLAPAQAAAIHVFNCMFYTCLTTPNNIEKGHKVVSRWTNKVDLFSKDYIIIPINFSFHWSLAVIIRPGAVQASLAQLQADVAHWKNWPSNSNNNSSAKKVTGSAKKKKNSTTASPAADEDELPAAAAQVQDLTLSNFNTQNSTAHASEPAENASLEDEDACINDGAKGSNDTDEGDDSSTEIMDIAAEVPTATVTASDAATPSKLKSGDALRTLDSLIHSTRNTPSSASAATSKRTSPTTDNASKCKDESTINSTCIIHMDSLGMHSTAAVGKALSSYLRFEWEARKKAELDAELDALLKTDGNKDMVEDEIEKMKIALEMERQKVFKNIDVVKIKVPIQANGYDCGLFVTKFAEQVLRAQPSSTDADIQDKFANILRSDAFSQVDVDGERQNMRDMIEGIRKDWQNRRDELKVLRQQQQQQQSETVAAGAQLASSSSNSSSGDEMREDVVEDHHTAEEEEEDGEDLGEAAVSEESGLTAAPRLMAHFTTGAKRKATAQDTNCEDRVSDTQLDSLFTEDAPIDNSSNSNGSSNGASQDSSAYMDCVEGSEGGPIANTQNTNTSSVPSSPAVTATATATSAVEYSEGDKKSKRDKKRKHSEKDREDEASKDPVVAASPMASSTPSAGKILSRTSTVNVATAISPDGEIPKVIGANSNFQYKTLPESRRHKHKKSRQDTEVTDTVLSVASPVSSMKKSAIVPVDMKALGRSALPSVHTDATAGGSNDAMHPEQEAMEEDKEEEDVGEDVGEPVQTAISTTHELHNLSLERTREGHISRYAGKNSSVSDNKERNVAVRMNTNIFDTVPVDNTVCPGANPASSNKPAKKYGKK